jgi:enhanced filamentous growth protein 1
MRYGGYPKTEMAPPARAGDEQEVKHELIPGPPHGEVEEHEQGEYTHTTAPYSAPRDPFSYGQGNPPAYPPNPSDPLSSSPSHPNGSGRATPRTSTIGSYGGPQRSTSNLYSVMGDTHGAPPPVNGAPEGAYPPTAYAPTYANGAPSNKRGRDDDDEYHPDDLKRRKTAPMGGAVGSPYDKNMPGSKAAR